jgi:UDP-N-acetylglucosamine:LPS N-acetylglucosamine transferase
MKIALVCSQGGHLTEMLFLMEAFDGHDIFFITHTNPRTNQLKYRKYLIENIGTDIRKMANAFFQTFKILRKEKPDLIVSTGSEIAIPATILARFMKIKTIYIESWCRVKTKSGTGRILYHFSNHFLVQWPDLVKKYGKKARYEGAVI